MSTARPYIVVEAEGDSETHVTLKDAQRKLTACGEHYSFPTGGAVPTCRACREAVDEWAVTAILTDQAQADQERRQALRKGLGTMGYAGEGTRDETPTECGECFRTRPRWTMDQRPTDQAWVCSPRCAMRCHCKPSVRFVHYTEDEHRHGPDDAPEILRERHLYLSASAAGFVHECATDDYGWTLCGNVATTKYVGPLTEPTCPGCAAHPAA